MMAVDVPRLRDIIRRLQVGRADVYGYRVIRLPDEDAGLLVDLLEEKIASRFDVAT